MALGSSIQIAILAIPLAVLAGWAMGKPFALDLDPLSTLIFFLSVILANTVTADGRSQVRGVGWGVGVGANEGGWKGSGGDEV